MLKRLISFYLVLAVCVMLGCAGCGTLMTRFVAPNWSPPDPKLSRIYSGTQFDFRCFLKPSMHETQGIGGFCLVDVPFSIIADTVILPLTIYEQIKYGSYASGKAAEVNKKAETTAAEKTEQTGLVTKESISSQSSE